MLCKLLLPFLVKLSHSQSSGSMEQRKDHYCNDHSYEHVATSQTQDTFAVQPALFHTDKPLPNPPSPLVELSPASVQVTDADDEVHANLSLPPIES